MPKDPQKPIASDNRSQEADASRATNPQGDGLPPSPETPPPAPSLGTIPSESPEEAAIQTGAEAPPANQQAIEHQTATTPGEAVPPEKSKRVAWNKGMKLGPGRTKSTVAQPGQPGQPASVLVDAPSIQAMSQAEIDACRVSGRASADTFILISRTVGGKEWGPDDQAEQDALREGWADTYQHYGWNKTPGWMPLVASTGAYAMKRLSRPETAARMQTFKEKIATWWAKRQALKATRSQLHG